MYLIDMCESSSKDTVVAVLSHIGFSAVLHNTVVDNACDVHQSRLDSISWSYYKYSITWSIQQPGVVTIALPVSSSQGTSFNKFTLYPFFNQLAAKERIRFLFTLFHQSIKGMMRMRKLISHLRSYVMLIRRFISLLVKKLKIKVKPCLLLSTIQQPF